MKIFCCSARATNPAAPVINLDEFGRISKPCDDRIAMETATVSTEVTKRRPHSAPRDTRRSHRRSPIRHLAGIESSTFRAEDNIEIRF